MKKKCPNCKEKNIRNHIYGYVKKLDEHDAMIILQVEYKMTGEELEKDVAFAMARALTPDKDDELMVGKFTSVVVK